MTTRTEFYQRLREYIPDEAARIIADEMTTETDIVSRFEKLATKTDVDLSVERLRSDMFRWMLVFFAPLWIGVYGTLVAIILRIH